MYPNSSTFFLSNLSTKKAAENPETAAAMLYEATTKLNCCADILKYGIRKFPNGIITMKSKMCVKFILAKSNNKILSFQPINPI
jgi:hypothetical protein